METNKDYFFDYDITGFCPVRNESIYSNGEPVEVLNKVISGCESLEIDSFHENVPKQKEHNLKNMLNGHSSAADELSAENARLKKSFKELKEKSLDLEGTIAKLQEDLSVKMHDLLAKDEELDVCKEKLHTLETENKEINAKMDQLKAQIFQLNELNNTKNEEKSIISELQKEVTIKEKHQNKLKSELAEKNSLLRQKTRENKNILKKLENFQIFLEEKGQLSAEQREQFLNMKADNLNDIPQKLEGDFSSTSELSTAKNIDRKILENLSNDEPMDCNTAACSDSVIEANNKKAEIQRASYLSSSGNKFHASLEKQSFSKNYFLQSSRDVIEDPHVSDDCIDFALNELSELKQKLAINAHFAPISPLPRTPSPKSIKSGNDSLKKTKQVIPVKSGKKLNFCHQQSESFEVETSQPVEKADSSVEKDNAAENPELDDNHYKISTKRNADGSFKLNFTALLNSEISLNMNSYQISCLIERCTENDTYNKLSDRECSLSSISNTVTSSQNIVSCTASEPPVSTAIKSNNKINNEKNSSGPGKNSLRMNLHRQAGIDVFKENLISQSPKKSNLGVKNVFPNSPNIKRRSSAHANVVSSINSELQNSRKKMKLNQNNVYDKFVTKQTMETPSKKDPSRKIEANAKLSSAFKTPPFNTRVRQISKLKTPSSLPIGSSSFSDDASQQTKEVQNHPVNESIPKRAMKNFVQGGYLNPKDCNLKQVVHEDEEELCFRKSTKPKLIVSGSKVISSPVASSVQNIKGKRTKKDSFSSDEGDPAGQTFSQKPFSALKNVKKRKVSTSSNKDPTTFKSPNKPKRNGKLEGITSSYPEVQSEVSQVMKNDIVLEVIKHDINENNKVVETVENQYKETLLQSECSMDLNEAECSKISTALNSSCSNKSYDLAPRITDSIEEVHITNDKAIKEISSSINNNFNSTSVDTIVTEKKICGLFKNFISPEKNNVSHENIELRDEIMSYNDPSVLEDSPLFDKEQPECNNKFANEEIPIQPVEDDKKAEELDDFDFSGISLSPFNPSTFTSQACFSPPSESIKRSNSNLSPKSPKIVLSNTDQLLESSPRRSPISPNKNSVMSSNSCLSPKSPNIVSSDTDQLLESSPRRSTRSQNKNSVTSLSSNFSLSTKSTKVVSSDTDQLLENSPKRNKRSKNKNSAMSLSSSQMSNVKDSIEEMNHESSLKMLPNLENNDKEKHSQMPEQVGKTDTDALAECIKLSSMRDEISDSEHSLVIAESIDSASKASLSDHHGDMEEMNIPPIKQNKKRKTTKKQKKKGSNKKDQFKKNLPFIQANSIELAFKALQVIKYSDKHIKQTQHTFVNALINPAIVQNAKDAVFEITQFLCSCKANPLLAYSVSENSEVLLPQTERVILGSILEITNKKKNHLLGLHQSLMNTWYLLILTKINFDMCELSSLCRVYTAMSKILQDKKPLLLCAELLKMQHKFAPYLIASIASIWKELFDFNTCADDVKLFLSTIVTMVQKKPPSIPYQRWNHCKIIFNSHLNAPILPDLSATVELIIHDIQKTCEKSENEVEFYQTAPLVIFTAYEGWDWAKKNLVDNHLIPLLVKYSEQERNEKAFQAFCEIYAQVCTFCPEIDDVNQVFNSFFERETSLEDNFVIDSVAVAQIAQYLERRLNLPQHLLDWIQVIQCTRPEKTAEVQNLFVLRLCKNEDTFTKDNIVD